MSAAPARDEAGVVMVLVALLTVAMLIVVAIVIDGGQGYADRRQMQNAADAAALAGARALSQIRFGGSAADLAAEVRSVIADNGGDPARVRCDVVDGELAPVAPCSPATGWLAVSGAIGVQVTAVVHRPSKFGRIAGIPEIRAAASAAATIQKLLRARSPWMVCGNGNLAGGYDLIDPATGSLRPDSVLKALYGAGGSALPDTRGIPLFGSVPSCGLSANWKGGVDPDSQPVTLGTFVPADGGKQVGKFRYDDVLAGVEGCPQDFEDGEFSACLALVPVFDAVDAGTQSARLAAFAVWRVRYDPNGRVKYWGQYVSAGVASRGTTTTDNVDGRSTFLIGLTR